MISRHLSIRSGRSGQSLLEMVFAIGILLIVLGSLITLTAASVAGQGESEEQFIANNLAREGLEVVRVVRDSNALSGVAWNSGLVGAGADGTAIAMLDPTQYTWSLNFTPNAVTDGTAAICRAAGRYFQSLTPCLSAQKTEYSRLLTISYICRTLIGAQSIQTPAGASCTIGTAIGVRVESQIRWLERGRTRFVTIQNLLYAWK